ncbi:hypothetical protein SipoB123_27660 [Streptomyces ipomoeae]|nr:hypothetical protein SipoB123_27660 [Streptomyces ipomoeae]
MSPVGQQPRQPFPQQHRILGDDHPHPVLHVPSPHAIPRAATRAARTTPPAFQQQPARSRPRRQYEPIEIQKPEEWLVTAVPLRSTDHRPRATPSAPASAGGRPFWWFGFGGGGLLGWFGFGGGGLLGWFGFGGGGLLGWFGFGGGGLFWWLGFTDIRPF